MTPFHPTQPFAGVAVNGSFLSGWDGMPTLIEQPPTVEAARTRSPLARRQILGDSIHVVPLGVAASCTRTIAQGDATTDQVRAA